MPKKKTIPDQGFIDRMLQITEKAGGQNALARLSGVPQSTLAAYLRGGEPGRPQLIALAIAANRSITWLATGKEEGEGAIAIALNNRDDKALSIKDGQNRPTATQENLRWIEEWMNEYYGKYPSLSMYLYEDLKDRYQSFREFVEKKRSLGDPQVGAPAVKSAVGE